MYDGGDGSGRLHNSVRSGEISARLEACKGSAWLDLLFLLNLLGVDPLGSDRTLIGTSAMQIMQMMDFTTTARIENSSGRV